MTRNPRISLGLPLVLLLVASATSAQTAPYVRTAIVSPTPGNPTASGTTLLTTLAGLSPAPSSTNRWLLKIEPGIYDVGTTPLQMLAWVDIEGSGVLATTIRGNVGPTLAILDEVSNLRTSSSLNQGVVRGASNAEIRELTIECVPSVSQPACMAMVNDTVSPRVTNLRILVTTSSAGSHWGMRNLDSSAQLNNVEIRVANATSGGDNYGIVNVGTSTLSIVSIRNSQIIVNGTGFNNWGILNRGQAKAQPINNTAITALSGSHAYGINTIEGTGVGWYYLENSSVNASLGSASSIGIRQGSVDSSLRAVVQQSRVAGDTYALELGAGSSTVTNSTLTGVTNSVFGGSVLIGGSWVSGSVSAISATCAGNWNGSMTFFASTCP